MDVVKLTEDKLDINEIYSQMVSHSTGAVSLFVGTTRDSFENKKVLKLEYEAFTPMAEKELLKVCRLIREKWKVEHIAFHHRLGTVPVGEASVVVAVSSVHRADSLEAVQFGIDTLKQSVPIWKKEIYEQGAPEWKANKECTWSNCADESSRKRKIEFETAEHVQIKASNAELERRIAAFIQRKRSESDVINIQEFCHRLPLEETQNSCARTEAMLVCRKDSKSHLKVSRCVNTYGPQTCSETVAISGNSVINPAVQERLENMEKHLGLGKKEQPVPPDVYARLKALEDRILYLESTSPEYFDDASRIQGKKDDDEAITKIDQRMEELRKKLGLASR